MRMLSLRRKNNILIYKKRAAESVARQDRPFPSSKNPHFQIEAKCRILLAKMSFSCMRIRNQLLCT